jgi:hypothetical protein
MLDEDDRRMIEKRRRSLRHLPVALWVVPLVWLGACLWTWFRFPLLNNPWDLHSRLSRGEVGGTMLETLAAMAPVLTLLLQLVVIAFIWMGVRMLQRERRLIQLLDAAIVREAQRPPTV